MTEGRTGDGTAVDEATEALLRRFVTEVRAEVAPVAVWAHGSLGGGDYREGHSDLDLVAVLPGPPDRSARARVERMHLMLHSSDPLAARLHCAYLDAVRLDDPGRDHVVWAHAELYERPLSPVARRELHAFGRVLHGPPPPVLLPPVSDAELRAFVLAEQLGYWREMLGKDRLWREHVWVDIGLLTHARATVTLRDGRLVTKGEALTVLAELGAPADVVADVRARRYGRPPPRTDAGWHAERALLVREFLSAAIGRLERDHG